MTSPFVHALAASWLEFLALNSVLASVVVLVALLVVRVSRRVLPAMALVMWSLVFLRLLLPPGLCHPWSLGSLAARWLDSHVVAATAGPFGVNDIYSLATPERSHPAVEAAPAASGWALLLTLAWAAGAAAVYGRYRHHLAALRAVASASSSPCDAGVDRLVRSWRGRLGIRRAVKLVVTEEGVSPFTLGVLRPVIVVPASLVDDRSALEPTIAHEMAHVARFDALWLGMQHALRAVYFFHPLVWLSAARFDEAREQAVDAAVVASGGLDARRYAVGLLAVARHDLALAVVPAMSSRKRRIAMRIQNLFDPAGCTRMRPVTTMLWGLLAAAVVLPLGAGAAVQGEESAASVLDRSLTAAPSDERVLEHPLPSGRETWGWGPGRDPWTGGEVFHRGIDLAAPAGSEVTAAAAGHVAVATEHFAPSPASGTVIVLDHGNGLQTLYTHLGTVEVAEGQEVSAGQVIATVGSTGRSTGPHLHFEVRVDGDARNPAGFLVDGR